MPISILGIVPRSQYCHIGNVANLNVGNELPMLGLATFSMSIERFPILELANFFLCNKRNSHNFQLLSRQSARAQFMPIRPQNGGRFNGSREAVVS